MPSPARLMALIRKAQLAVFANPHAPPTYALVLAPTTVHRI
ncbi:Uncharacterised protein [Mycobacteroides abscessus subsp. abscessus]|nr:Uncharacterised protein [Mycobacteroides abscessus subsp. abscessus]